MLARHASPKFFKLVARLPVFRFTDEDLALHRKDIAPWRETIELVNSREYMNFIPFKELAVVFDDAFMIFNFDNNLSKYSVHDSDSEKSSKEPGITVCQFPLKNDFLKIQYSHGERGYVGVHTFLYRFDCEGLTAQDGGNLPQMLSRASVIQYHDNAEHRVLDERVPDEQIESQGRAVISLIWLFHEAESKHMIKVERKKRPGSSKPKRSRHEWRARLPTTHYIYLDAPPAGSAGCNSGTGKPLTTGHRRRAHWRTLRAERFKKHPSYMKRIRIREAWIGPKTWSDSGAVYTVMDEDYRSST